MKVTLRQKKTTGERATLFLDIYPPICKRNADTIKRKIYLRLFVYLEPKTKFEKLHNKKTFEFAETIRLYALVAVMESRYQWLFDKDIKLHFVDGIFQGEHK